MTCCFRNVGPRVFISYCFKDKDAARRVSSFLTSKGCRVQMEDEVSLIGRRLEVALRERIGQAEGFVQLRTTSAVASQWVAKELEYASAPRDGNRHLVLAPVVFERGDVIAVPDEMRAIDATCGLSDKVLDLIGARIAEAVHVLPLSDADPFRFEPNALDQALRTAPVDHRRVIIDSDGKLLQWMDDCLAFIESSSVPHKQNWLRQECKRQEQLLRFLDDLDREAATLLACLFQAYVRWKCVFPGSASQAMEYFCLVRVGLAVVQRACQLPVQHHELFKYANIFRSLQERLPEDEEPDNAYLSWIAGGDRFRIMPSNEDIAALAALRHAGIDDKSFTYFVQEAKRDIASVLQRIKENAPL